MSAVFAFVGEYAAFGFVMRFVAIGECKQKYGRNGKVRFRTRYSCCCRSAINGFAVRFVVIGECKQIYGRKGMYGCGRDIPAVAKVSQMASLCGLRQSENVRSNTAGTGIYGFGRGFLVVAEV